MAVTWNITSGTLTKTAADWGVSGIRRSRRSQAVDTCTFTAVGRAVDAAPLFARGSTVTIKRDSTPWFVGRVTQVPGSGSPTAEDQTYTLSGPWWYLENLICRQHWHVNGDTTATALSTRLILGQGVDGGRMTTAEVLTETLNFAKDAGAPFVIGTIDPAVLYPPFDEVKDTTCAAVIQQVLRWHPDCVAWFDYATGPYPTLHIRRRANLSAAKQTLGTAPLSSIGEIAAREDLQPPAVVLIYEVTSSINGQSRLDLQIEAAPAGATGMEFGAVVATLPMRGVSSSAVSQRVVTSGLVDSLAQSGAQDARAFLLSRDPWLVAQANDPAITSGGISITQISRTLADPNSKVPQFPNNPTGPQVYDTYDADLDRILVSGQIADWMTQRYSVRAQVQRIDYTCTLDTGDGTNPSTLSAPIKRSIEFTATNAGSDSAEPSSSLVYSTTTDYDPGDVVPVGLAAAYLAALSQLQYSGSVTLLEEEVSGAVGLGKVLNLAGSSQAAWAAMRALIVSEDVDVDQGTTSVSFGPAEHLSPADLVSLMRVTRPGSGGGRVGDGPAANGTANSAARVSGSTGRAGEVVLGHHTPTRNSTGDSGGGRTLRWWNVGVNGTPAYAQFDSGEAVFSLPDNLSPQNPN